MTFAPLHSAWFIAACGFGLVSGYVRWVSDRADPETLAMGLNISVATAILSLICFLIFAMKAVPA